MISTKPEPEFIEKYMSLAGLPGIDVNRDKWRVALVQLWSNSSMGQWPDLRDGEDLNPDERLRVQQAAVQQLLRVMKATTDGISHMREISASAA